MTAEEMFEKMGYKQTGDGIFFISYIYKSDFLGEIHNSYKTIYFDLNYQTVGCTSHYNKKEVVGELFIDEIQAINKQIEELGW